MLTFLFQRFIVPPTFDSQPPHPLAKIAIFKSKKKKKMKHLINKSDLKGIKGIIGLILILALDWHSAKIINHLDSHFLQMMTSIQMAQVVNLVSIDQLERK